MVMTIAKITAGDGYTYLTRHVANGDAGTEGRHAAAAYYTAQGNPPGQWTGRGVHLIGLDGQQVTEEQMRALFGQGEHPNSDAMIAAYLRENIRAGMTERQRQQVTAAAVRHATLGRRFPAYQALDEYESRVKQRLAIIAQEAGREPTQAEVKEAKAGEARRRPGIPGGAGEGGPGGGRGPPALAGDRGGAPGAQKPALGGPPPRRARRPVPRPPRHHRRPRAGPRDRRRAVRDDQLLLPPPRRHRGPLRPARPRVPRPARAGPSGRGHPPASPAGHPGHPPGQAATPLPR